jgi:site-specific DNA-methyltransferase (adenine-specific)
MDCEPFILEVKDQTPAVVTAPAYGTLDLRRADCMDMMAEFPDGYFDLAIVDPPYGIGRDKEELSTSKHGGRKAYDCKNWDSTQPAPKYFTELRRVSKNQIIFSRNPV